MISARVFLCHDLDLAEVTRMDTQVFQQLCQRLRETGAEVVTYAGRASEEGFLPFLHQELPTCQWFLVFQTPEINLVSEVRTAVNIAQMYIKPEPRQGLLRFLVHSDEAPELVPEWSAIPTVGASHDYLRAIEKLILALSLNDEITVKEEPIAPPPPPPPFASSQVASPLLLSTYDAQIYSQPSEVQPAYNPYPYNSSPDRPPAPPTRLSLLKTAHPTLTKVLLATPILAILLIVAFGAISPLQALVGRFQNKQQVASLQNHTSAGTTATPTSQSTIGAPQPKATPAPTSTSKVSLAPGVPPTPTATPKPAPTPTPRPTPTPTPKPICPATIQYGSMGSLVSMLQTELNARGMVGADGKPLAVDGDFGSNTQYAVKSWQTKEHIEVDGVVGPITWHTLGNC